MQIIRIQTKIITKLMNKTKKPALIKVRGSLNTILLLHMLAFLLGLEARKVQNLSSPFCQFYVLLVFPQHTNK